MTSTVLVPSFFVGGVLFLYFAVAGWNLHRRTFSLPRRVVGGSEVAIAETIGPAVVGVIRPRIVIPISLLGTSRETLAMVIAQEEKHLRARKSDFNIDRSTHSHQTGERYDVRSPLQ